MSGAQDWIKTGSLAVGALVSVARLLFDYRRMRQEEAQAEEQRQLQKKAWDLVMSGELTEVRVGDLHVKAVAAKDKKVSAPAEPAQAPAESEPSPED